MAYMYVTLVHRNSYNAHISDMLREICKMSSTEGVNSNIKLDSVSDKLDASSLLSFLSFHLVVSIHSLLYFFYTSLISL